MDNENWKPETALVSVSDKAGIVPFCQGLVAQGVTIYSTGGTAKALRAGEVPVTDVSEFLRNSLRTFLERHGVDEEKITVILEETGGEFLGDRVKTLSREISAGLLARYTEKDLAEIERIGVPSIDIVVVNYYPLTKTIATAGVTREQVIDGTDIGGPTMMRSGAKGRRILVPHPECYDEVLVWLRDGMPNADAFIPEGVAEAEFGVAGYALASAEYHGAGTFAGLLGRRAANCKYGENPYMKPADLYACETDDPLALQKFTLVDGDAPSFVNWTDIDSMLQTITHIAAAYDVARDNVPKIAVGVKHGNACGTSQTPDAESAEITACTGMLDGDRIAVFGGLVMLNYDVDATLATTLRTHAIIEGKRLLDGVIAPSFSEEAIAILGRKGGKCRCMANPALGALRLSSLDIAQRFRPTRGSFLKQPNYTFVLDLNDPRVVIHGELSDADRTNILLAWAIGATSTSNTITLVRYGMVIANAVGQQDRVGAAQLAIMRARRSGHDTRGATAYSDSFFPFPDGPEVLIEAGIRTIFASSGSVKDDEVIAVCKKAGVTLVMMPDKDCRGFARH